MVNSREEILRLANSFNFDVWGDGRIHIKFNFLGIKDIVLYSVIEYSTSKYLSMTMIEHTVILTKIKGEYYQVAKVPSPLIHMMRVFYHKVNSIPTKIGSSVWAHTTKDCIKLYDSINNSINNISTDIYLKENNLLDRQEILDSFLCLEEEFNLNLISTMIGFIYTDTFEIKPSYSASNYYGLALKFCNKGETQANKIHVSNETFSNAYFLKELNHIGSKYKYDGFNLLIVEYYNNQYFLLVKETSKQEQFKIYKKLDLNCSKWNGSTSIKNFKILYNYENI